MFKRDINLLLDDMLVATNKIKKYTKNMSFDDFIKDDKTVDAVIRNFEIVGEAANRIPQEYRNQHQNIEWNRIRGFRNRIVHEYFGIDYQIVWQIIENYLDNLTPNLIKLKDEKQNDR